MTLGMLDGVLGGGDIVRVEFLRGHSVEELFVQAADFVDEGVGERAVGVEIVPRGEEVDGYVVAEDEAVEHVVVELELEESRSE